MSSKKRCKIQVKCGMCVRVGNNRTEGETGSGREQLDPTDMAGEVGGLEIRAGSN